MAIATAVLLPGETRTAHVRLLGEMAETVAIAEETPVLLRGADNLPAQVQAHAVALATVEVSAAVGIHLVVVDLVAVAEVVVDAEDTSLS